jgi:glycosyltransferase involved in cell wall biosynthesis
VVHVIPYGVSHPQPTPSRISRAVELPIRFGFIGSIQPHKGLHIAVEALREIDPGRATLDVWGDDTIDPAYTRQVSSPSSRDAVRFHNRFDEAAKDEVFRSIDVLIVPSIGLESFGLVAYEAICRQIPVIVSRLGALAEIVESGGARAFESGNAAQLRTLVEALVAEPHQIEEWQTRLPSVKSIEQHAREVEGIYASMVRSSRR